MFGPGQQDGICLPAVPGLFQQTERLENATLAGAILAEDQGDGLPKPCGLVQVTAGRRAEAGSFFIPSGASHGMTSSEAYGLKPTRLRVHG